MVFCLSCWHFYMKAKCSTLPWTSFLNTLLPESRLQSKPKHSTQWTVIGSVFWPWSLLACCTRICITTLQQAVSHSNIDIDAQSRGAGGTSSDICKSKGPRKGSFVLNTTTWARLLVPIPSFQQKNHSFSLQPDAIMTILRFTLRCARRILLPWNTKAQATKSQAAVPLKVVLPWKHESASSWNTGGRAPESCAAVKTQAAKEQAVVPL